MYKPVYKLRDWIKEDRLNPRILSLNIHAIDYLKKNPEKIDWNSLSENTAAYELHEKNIDKIEWSRYCRNTKTMDLLKENKDKINWSSLSANPYAYEFLLNHYEEIDWIYFSLNTRAIEVLAKNQDKIHWSNLSENPNAISILKENPEKIDWCKLSTNPNASEIFRLHLDELYTSELSDLWEEISYYCNDMQFLLENKDALHWNICGNENACDFLIENQELIDWKIFYMSPKALEFTKKYYPEKIKEKMQSLSYAPWAIDILEQNQDQINWNNISLNRNIFELDYAQMKENIAPLEDELLKVVLHPMRVNMYLKKYNYNISELYY